MNENSTSVQKETESHLSDFDVIDAGTVPASADQPETRNAERATSDVVRPSGGQPGNQNARKHGFYANYMTRKEARIYEEAANISGTTAEITLLRCKLVKMLEDDPVDVALVTRVVGLINRLELNRLKVNGNDPPMDPMARMALRWMLDGENSPPGSMFAVAFQNLKTALQKAWPQ
jgi:hypothetical protein